MYIAYVDRYPNYMDDKVYEAARSSTAEGAADIPSYELSRLTPGDQSNVLHVAAQYGNHEFISALFAGGIHELLCKRNSNGETPLHLAAQSGCRETVEILLKAHDEEDRSSNLLGCWGERDNQGNTPLHTALRYGHEDIALSLLERDLQLVSLYNIVGESLAYLAAQNFCPKFLLKALDYDRASRCSASFSGPFGQTAFHPARKLSDTMLSILVERRKHLLKVKDIKGKTVLAYAVEESRESMVETLLKADTTLAYLHDNDGFTPLHKAASLGFFPMVQTILDLSPQSITIRDERQNKTALHVAKMEASFLGGCVKKTRMKELINAVDIDGNTALHLALMKSDIGSVDALLQVSGINWRLTNKEGLTPMDLCKSAHQIPIKMKCLASESERMVKDGMISMELFYAKEVTKVDDLLTRYDWEECSTFRGPNGDTILHIAARDGCIKTIWKAKRSSPDLLLWGQNSKGETPLHLAAEHGKFKVVMAITSGSINPHQNGNAQFLMIENGETNQQEDAKPWRIKSRNGDTPTHKALRNGHGRIALHILELDPELLTFVNKEDESLLYLAAEKLPTGRYFESILRICGDHCHSNSGPNGENPLHAATRNRASVMVGGSLISKQPGFMNMRDHSGKTPLHHAVENRQKFLVRSLLLRDKAAAFTYDNEGFTPLLRAAAMGHKECMEIIFTLCPHSAEPRHLSNNRTVLHLAKLCQSDTMRPVIRENFVKWANETDEDGNTPLHLAVIEADKANALFLREAGCLNWKIRNRQHQMPSELCKEELLKNDSNKQREIFHFLRGLKRGKLLFHENIIWRPWTWFNVIAREMELTSDERLEQVFNNIAVVAALLVTISFAALFTIPGGYDQDKGEVMRMKDIVIQVFVASNAFALVTGIGVLLNYGYSIVTGSLMNMRVFLRKSLLLLQGSVFAATVSFLCGVYAVAFHNATWVFVLSVVLASLFTIIPY